MFKEIQSPEEYNVLIAEGVIPIDVRSAEEYNESRIPEAIVGYDWNNGEFHDKQEDLDPSKQYLFICRSGNRSMQACLYLETQGYDHLYNLRGGMLGWTGATE